MAMPVKPPSKPATMNPATMPRRMARSIAESPRQATSAPKTAAQRHSSTAAMPMRPYIAAPSASAAKWDGMPSAARSVIQPTSKPPKAMVPPTIARATRPSRQLGASATHAHAIVQHHTASEAANFAGFTQTLTPRISRGSNTIATRHSTRTVAIARPVRASAGCRRCSAAKAAVTTPPPRDGPRATRRTPAARPARPGRSAAARGRTATRPGFPPSRAGTSRRR
jgi:hypothetical protein